jgi:aminodeoxyfutalosine synthase
MISNLSIFDLDATLLEIASKVEQGKRISTDDCIALYEKGELGFVGMLANHIREQRHGKQTFFNRNIHIEPTNICIYQCKFCSYFRKEGEEGSWNYSIDDILKKIESYPVGSITEVHIVGGVHPDKDLHYYGEMIAAIHKARPELHIKGFTAIELDFMIRKSNITVEDGLKKLKEYGLESIPGGGAEIFNDDIRKQICGDKSKATMWLNVHEMAHKVGLPSNATILYGHIETFADRVDHLNKLRDLQDRTQGFNAFIPLKYKHKNNLLSHIPELTSIEDLRNYAISRIFLDNFAHIKAYWPMIGKDLALISLSFGVDDMDGTIDDTTKIYSMAGSAEETPGMTSTQMVDLIKHNGFEPVERDSVYNIVKTF